MTNNARQVVGWDKVLNVDATAVTASQIVESQEEADLELTVDKVVKDWEADIEKNPIGKFEFYRHTPPFQTLDLELLTPKNSRRQECVSIYADIDNFTAYVAKHIDDDEDAKHVVKTLHVLRSELDAVLHEDFAGKKVRFIGDCIHGILIEGTAQTTEDEETAKCCRRRKSVEIWRHKTAAEFGVDRLTHKGPGGPLVIYGRWGQKGGSFSGGSLRVMRSSRYRSSKAIS